MGADLRPWRKTCKSARGTKLKEVRNMQEYCSGCREYDNDMQGKVLETNRRNNYRVGNVNL